MNNDLPMIIAWYEQSDWDEWLEVCPGQMCSTWHEWHSCALKVLEEASSDRVLVHTPKIRPKGYLEWVKRTGKPNSGISRSEYAGEQIKDRLMGDYRLPEKLPNQAELNRKFRKAIKDNPELRVFEIFDPYLRRPSAGICPIFREGVSGQPEQYGSGILLRLGDERFLLSAAHVLDDFKKFPILIPGSESLVYIHGPYSVTPLPESGLRKDDNFDLGYFHFNAPQRDDIDSSLLFLDASDSDPMDVTSDGDAYTLIGYQSELSKSTGELANTEITRVSCSGVQDHRYKKLELDPKTHILIQYRMKKGVNYKNLIQGKKHDFGGMSGGGVYAWSKNFPNPKAIAQPQLVGVITGYSNYHNVFIATRLHHVLSAIHKEYPHLPIG